MHARTRRSYNLADLIPAPHEWAVINGLGEVDATASCWYTALQDYQMLNRLYPEDGPYKIQEPETPPSG